MNKTQLDESRTETRQRRVELIRLLTETDEGYTAPMLSEIFNVSSQIIVSDLQSLERIFILDKRRMTSGNKNYIYRM